jgi:hypothetical protein
MVSNEAYFIFANARRSDSGFDDRKNGIKNNWKISGGKQLDVLSERKVLIRMEF